MSKSNKKPFFQHPFAVMTRTTTSKPNPTKLPFSFQQQRDHLINLKIQDNKAKQKQLEQNKKIIESLNQTLLSSGAQIDKQKQKLELILESLRKQQRQKQLELESCQEIESIDPEEYKVWNQQTARRNHKARMKVLKQQYQVLKNSKSKQLQDLKNQLEDIKNEQKQLSLKLEMLKGEQSNIVQIQQIFNEESDQQIPDTDKIVSEIAKLRESILDLQEQNINLINKVKDDLDSSSWNVRQRFNECKQRIQKQIKKLTEIMQKSDNQVFRKVQNPDKIADPNNLIQDYQNRLKKIQDSLPEQLKQDKIFECLKPLPWRSIKGINIENKSNTAIHQKFEKLMAEFTQAEEQNKKYKNMLATKQSEIETIKSKISQYEYKIKQIKNIDQQL